MPEILRFATVINRMSKRAPRMLSPVYMAALKLLPYCIVETKRGWLALDREYTPLGHPRNEGNTRIHYDYDTVEPTFTAAQVFPENAVPYHPIRPPAKLDSEGRRIIYFFADFCAPWAGSRFVEPYLARLGQVLPVEKLIFES